jgi:hypothetical protein
MWPTICVDDFFNDPDKVVEISKDLKFESRQFYPGTRSVGLHQVDANLFNWLSNKIIALLYPNDWENISWFNSAFFQKVPSGLKNDGWVHQDSSVEFTAIIYLSKNLDIGTSIYNRKNFYKESKAYGDKGNIKFHNCNFKETINIKGIYNRLVLFDGASHHAAHINNTGEDRLTLICFFEKLTLNSSNKQLKYMIPTSRKI